MTILVMEKFSIKYEDAVEMFRKKKLPTFIVYEMDHLVFIVVILIIG